ncbi:MAG: hypothetical protein ACXW33_00375 [Sulfuricurvum sp.]
MVEALMTLNGSSSEARPKAMVQMSAKKGAYFACKRFDRIGSNKVHIMTNQLG